MINSERCTKKNTRPKKCLGYPLNQIFLTILKQIQGNDFVGVFFGLIDFMETDRVGRNSMITVGYG